MKRAALAMVLAAVAVACGSNDNGGSAGSLDVAAVNAHFDNPDGTVSDGNIGSVLSSRDSASGADLGVAGTSGSSSSSGTSKQSLRFLDDSVTSSCTAFSSGQRAGSCACPNGGSFDYDIEAAGDQQSGAGTMHFNLNACDTGGSVANGSEYIHFETSGQGAETKSTILIVLDVTVAEKNGKTIHIDAQERFSNGVFELAAKVDDGWVSTSYGYDKSTGNATVTVKDKNGTLSCSDEAGKYTCTGTGGRSFSWSGQASN